VDPADFLQRVPYGQSCEQRDLLRLKIARRSERTNVKRSSSSHSTTIDSPRAATGKLMRSEDD
jgi:hypothetical protein